MLSTSDLSFAYHGSQAITFPDIQLGSSSSMLITGPSGIGKSTLLKLVAGFLPAASGVIVVAGQSMNKDSAKQRDLIRKKHIGVIAQHPRAIAALTVEENLEMVHFLTSTKSDEIRNLNLLKELGIEKYVKSKPAALSIGEQQRLAIAMATVHKPDLILADEPTSGLDTSNCNKVLDLLSTQVELIGASLLIISHDDRLIKRFENQMEL